MNAAPTGSTPLLSVKRLAQVAGQLSQDDFVRQYPRAAILVPATPHASLGDDGTETGRYEATPFNTGGFITTAGSRSPLAKDLRDTSRMRHLEAAVTPLRKSSRNSFADMITVGRAANNDIIIPVGSVSKLHGYFLQDKGQWRFCDAGSSNGTVARGARLDARKPVDLADGDEIFLGPDVPVVFMSPLGLHTMVKIFSKYIK